MESRVFLRDQILSTLAAQILYRLADDDNALLISLKGETDPDQVLDTIGKCLFSLCIKADWDKHHPLRRLSGVLREPKCPWRDRFDYLSDNLLARIPVIFLFDNFEDNLQNGAVGQKELATLLARWLQAPRRSRLVFTCRYPFALPDETQERLAAFHLGPLSWAETRKLFWRLDGLKALSLEDQRRAYENVGGHPRALEYLDAILRGGQAQFEDVTIRLKQQLKAKGITDPARWIGRLDAALAEEVTFAAADVLLDQLLAQLADDPLARRLLIGAAVYRVPVTALGLTWSVGESEHDPDWLVRQKQRNRLFDLILPPPAEWVRTCLQEAQKKNPAVGLDDVMPSVNAPLSDIELKQWRREWLFAEEEPPRAPQGFLAAKQRLMELSLLAPVRFADDTEEMFVVHRWTAGALAKRTSEDERTAAHQAAAYWCWRAGHCPQPRQQAIEYLLEARHHLLALGDLTKLYEVSSVIIAQLNTWGAWEWEERLTRETLAWMPERSAEAGHLL